MNKNHEFILLVFNVGIITISSFFSSNKEIPVSDIIEYFKYT